MKKFIKRLFIFFIPVIAFIAVWEYGLSTMTNSYMLKREQLETQATKIEVLVLGGSYTLRGVNPAYFCMKGYNLGDVEQSLFYDSRITLKYLDKMTSLKVVLVAISYNSLWLKLYGSRIGFRVYYYAHYWGIRYPAVKWYNIRNYSNILDYGNSTAFGFALKGFKVNLVRDYQDNGWAIKWRKSRPMNDLSGKIMMNRVNKSCKKAILDSNISYVEDLLEQLNKRGIHPVIFSPPVTVHTYKFMEPNRVKTMDSAISGLCAIYHCKFYDYQEDKRFTDKDFEDVNHLNPEGAAKFSKIINNEILAKYCVSSSK